MAIGSQLAAIGGWQPQWQLYAALSAAISVIQWPISVVMAVRLRRLVWLAGIMAGWLAVQLAAWLKLAACSYLASCGQPDIGPICVCSS